MAFRKKTSQILKINPNLLLLQECEHPQKIEDLASTSNVWVGNNKNKGIGIFGFHNLKVELHSNYSSNYRYIVPIIIPGYKKIVIFIVWAMNNAKEPKRRYIGEVYNALHYYQEIFTSQTIIMGDFNWNIIWDTNLRNPLYGTFTEVIALLKKYQITSVYHTREKQNFGEETQPTFFQYKYADKPYHIDYMFASSALLHSIQSFQIGNYEQWKKLSDHMPLICELNENCLK